MCDNWTSCGGSADESILTIPTIRSITTYYPVYTHTHSYNLAPDPRPRLIAFDFHFRPFTLFQVIQSLTKQREKSFVMTVSRLRRFRER